jgi:hypothetical protein
MTCLVVALRRLGYIRDVAGASDTRPGRRGTVAVLAVCLLVVVTVAAAPAQAAPKPRPIYINAELSQTYAAVRPAGERWVSTATMSAYYRTTGQALATGDGTLVLTPRATVGRFAATLTDSLPAVSRTCVWHGARGRGQQLGQLQVGTPFAEAFSIQWPGYPGMWAQSLSGASAGQCTPTFTANPLQGTVTWALGAAGGTSGGNHFLFAATPRATAVESGPFSASISAMTMRSLLTTPDGQSYAVSAQGFLVESRVPFAGHRNVVEAPAARAGGTLAAPLRTGALRKLAFKLVPSRIPRGCVVGQTRRRDQRCP